MDEITLYRVEDPKALQYLEEGASTSRVTIQVPFARAPTDLHASELALRSALERARARLLERREDEAAVRAWMERVAGLPEALEELDADTRTIVLLGDEDGWAWSWLTASLPERVTVASHFALRPLLRAFEQDRRFRVLAVSPNRVAAYEGDARGLRELETPELPGSLEDALGHEVEGGSISFRSEQPVPGRSRPAPIYHGHGDAKAERDVDRERFHRALAEALEKHWGALQWPVVLAADVTTAAALRRHVEHPVLLEPTLRGSPEDWSAEELHTRAREIVREHLRREEAQRALAFERTRNRGKVRSDLPSTIADALAGRVARLWVEEEARRPGLVDEEQARAIPAGDPQEDVLDALAAIVLRRGGEVRVVPEAGVPGGGSFAVELR